MSVNPTISTAWAKGIVRLFDSVGLDARRLFSDVGLDYELLADHEARFPSAQISDLWELAVERSGNPDLGLAQPDIASPSSFDVVLHVMMTCPNLLSAIRRYLPYMQIVSNSADIGLIPLNDGYGLTVTLNGGGRSVPRARIAFVVLTILNNLRWLTGLALRPLAVEFPYPEPDNLQLYEVAFRCPLRFNSPVHQICLSHADLTAPLPTANPVLAILHARVADEQVNKIDKNLVAQVKQLIIRDLPNGSPLRGDVAKELCMSERTLHRRLNEGGTSFNKLVDEVRLQLADQYLRTATITLPEAAYLLGFADQSELFRACKRWFGVPPREYRIQIANGTDLLG